MPRILRGLFGTAPSPAGQAAFPAAGPATSSASGAPAADGNSYTLRGIYFQRAWFATPAECLTAAYARHLPLELCQ